MYVELYIRGVFVMYVEFRMALFWQVLFAIWEVMERRDHPAWQLKPLWDCHP